MNLRNAGDYNIGLDIGTGSVGWSVTDADKGELLHFKGKPTWGSRLFPNAESAAGARVYRGQRRRYHRRKWRLQLLQEIFSGEMNKVDPEFFVRLNQSNLLKEDRVSDSGTFTWVFFNDEKFNDKDYFKKYPTIYHLRKWLMESHEKADIRLVYLALHNIVKHRGNFLQQDARNLNSESADIAGSIEEFCATLQEYCDGLDIPCSAAANEESIVGILHDTKSSRSHLKESLSKQFGIEPCDLLDKKGATAMAKALAGAVVGLKSKLESIFFITEEAPEGAVTDIYLSSDEQTDAFGEICPDFAWPLFESMLKVYSSFVLQEILSSAPGQSLSVNKVADYGTYGDDLKLLKSLVREYAPAQYDEFFRGDFYKPTELHPQKYIYDKAKAKGYTKYNAVRTESYDDFKKDVTKLFAGTAAEDDPRYKDMMERFGNEKFLRRLKTSDNGAIPFQLHLEEMDAIIKNQAKFYPFLAERQKELDSLVTFRIPYYVGPLTQKNARKDAGGNNRFAWAVRLEGKENEVIKPWNWEEIIDKDRSATEFIQRMTATCTYLQGEPVLPRNSLLYEEFCVLNELNGAHFTQDGDKTRSFDYRDRSDMFEELFKKGRVSYKKVSDWMRQRGNANVHVSGGQGETGFESKLGSYIFFAKDVLGTGEILPSDYPMIEEIILWSTLFEDRGIFEEKLRRNYGDRFTEEQIKKIVRKRFTGWGKLSRKLLCGLKAPTDNGPVCIMDVLREGNPNSDAPSKPMVFNQIIRDDNLGFGSMIDEFNKTLMAEVGGLALEELPGSPALRRGVKQAMDVVREIVHIAGHEPKNIFIEVTREEDSRKKGQTNRTKRRYAALQEAMQRLKEEAPEFWNAEVSAELANHARKNEELDEKLTLYFMQNGKSLYSGKPIDIGRLSSGDYHVDHIIPQSYIKDDSFENKALVLAGENEAKSDQLLIDQSVRGKMRKTWDALKQAKLMGEKKYANLLRDHIGEKQLKGFIARQLVETSQIMKLVQAFLQEEYPDSAILPVKAGLSSDLRHRIDLVKCREANDFHHAHDALLASEIGRFIQKRHPGMYDNPIGYTHVMREFVKKQSQENRKGNAPGDSAFVISSFLTSGYDEETGELRKDDWSASQEIDKLKRYFNYRQCHISRMPEEASGAFWDETIYSPRDTGKKMTLPLKKGMDPEKYGSYSREQFAYFFIYKAMKKNKEVLEFAPVPVRVASEIASRKDALAQYASQLAKEKGLDFLDVVRPKIYKYQLMEMDGSRLYLTGLREARNATQFAFDRKEMQIVNAIFHEGDLSNGELDGLYKAVLGSLEKYSPKLASALNVDSWADQFEALPTQEKTELLKTLVAIGNGKSNVADLRNVGGAKYGGQIMPTYSSILTKDSGITFIDQSVTGMFERGTHIGL